MRPYYQDESATIYFADCREVLPVLADKSVSHTITDPPYSKHVHSKSRAGETYRDSGDMRACISRRREFGFEHLDFETLDFCAREFARLSRRWVLTFSDIESCDKWRRRLKRHGLEYVRTGLWRKADGAPQFTGDRPAVACEAITICHPKGRKRWNGGGSHGFWDYSVVQNNGGAEPRVHTAQKPLKLMKRLITLFTDPGELILDPFLGSGTTLHAAKELGRKSIGIDDTERNCEIAAERLMRIKAGYVAARSKEQGGLFATVAPARDAGRLEAAPAQVVSSSLE